VAMMGKDFVRELDFGYGSHKSRRPQPTLRIFIAALVPYPKKPFRPSVSDCGMVLREIEKPRQNRSDSRWVGSDPIHVGRPHGGLFRDHRVAAQGPLLRVLEVLRGAAPREMRPV